MLNRWISKAGLCGALLCLTLPGMGQTRPQSAELVLHNGKIATVDPELGEVQALAASGSCRIAIRPGADIDRLAGGGRGLGW